MLNNNRINFYRGYFFGGHTVDKIYPMDPRLALNTIMIQRWVNDIYKRFGFFVLKSLKTGKKHE